MPSLPPTPHTSKKKKRKKKNTFKSEGTTTKEYGVSCSGRRKSPQIDCGDKRPSLSSLETTLNDMNVTQAPLTLFTSVYRALQTLCVLQVGGCASAASSERVGAIFRQYLLPSCLCHLSVILTTCQAFSVSYLLG